MANDTGKGKALEARLQALEERVEVQGAMIDKLGQQIAQLKVWTGADETNLFGPELVTLVGAVEDLRAKVEGRNKSAPVKRNMTDADAIRVLAGDVSTLGHKEAAEAVGLTYAQVYSCRLGFTFKHVHRSLEKSGWRSQWAKG